MTIDLTPFYPIATTVFLSFLSYAALRLAAYLDERKKFSAVSRVAMGIGTIAGNVRREMLLNPGAPTDTLRTLQARAIKDGVDYMQGRYAETFKSLGGVDPATLAAMIAGAIGNQAPPPAAPPLVADAAVSMHPPAPASPAPEPASPLTEAVAPLELRYGPRADEA